MPKNNLTLTWLGQSGFLLKAGETTIACDLYLSDYCQKKSKLDHTRLAPIPVKPEALTDVAHYLITHSHIDHFDPETVGPLIASNPGVRFYCPPSCRSVIQEYVPESANRFTIVRSLKETILADGITLVTLPAAHEDLEKDESGEYIAYSYLLLFDALRKAVFFAGDTVPFDGQGKLIRTHTPAGYELTMVLPVNGRDAERAELGFKGNLSVDEAIALLKECEGRLLVPCHFGMFALNDIKEPLHESFFENQDCPIAIPAMNTAIEL